ncbi:class I glutamine amidotransferase-like protein [Amylocarpus encephaloides]|uniref:Class I glutamine amidotransferase-like protein n=1 Tax=Amylocarpus encephaloides TaxID=45428 RepID=A0A9P7Y8B6_9HELO|nr:class I glutamine amidotransferase-like protein [Amylocarpus encephaloides]
MTTPKVLIPMSDYGHDPTETALPFTAFKAAGFSVHFATETGQAPACDEKMLVGITRKLLGAAKPAVEAYHLMAQAPEFQSPLAWSAPSFDLEPYHLIFLPGGHDKGVRQLLDSPIIHAHLASYFPRTRKPSARCVAAVCHGVMVLSETEGHDGRSVIHECETTALPTRFEQAAFWGTRVWLGGYYKTYGVGSENVEESVTKKLDDPRQFQRSLGMGPFVVEDKKYNYLSGRFPNDAQLLAERTIALVQGTLASGMI